MNYMLMPRGPFFFLKNMLIPKGSISKYKEENRPKFELYKVHMIMIKAITISEVHKKGRRREIQIEI